MWKRVCLRRVAYAIAVTDLPWEGVAAEKSAHEAQSGTGASRLTSSWGPQKGLGAFLVDRDRRGFSDVVDVSVVLGAARRRDRVVTSDVDDLRAIATHVRGVAGFIAP